MRHIYRLGALVILMASSTWSWAQPGASGSPSPADIAKAKRFFRSAEAHKQLGDELQALGETASARKEYALAARDYMAGYKLSKLRLFLYNLGSIYRLRGNQQWAIRCYQAFLDSKPDNEKDVKDAFTFIAELAQDLASGAKSAAADPSIDPTRVCVPGQVAAPPIQKQPSSSSDPWPDTWLKIVTNPPGAKVYIDGKDVGPSGRAYAVSAGEYTVRVELDGYRPAEKTVNVPDAEITRIELALGKHTDAPRDTWLKIITDPPGAKVYINGKDVGPSGRAYMVSAGEHKVRVELDGYRPAEKTVSVATEITRIDLALSKDIDAAAGPRRYGIWKWLTLGTGAGVTTLGIIGIAMHDDARFDDNGARLPEKWDTMGEGVFLTIAGACMLGLSGYFFYNDATSAESHPSPNAAAPRQARGLSLQRYHDGWGIDLSGRF